MMTERVERLGEYVHELRDWLHLHAWQIDIIDERPPSDVSARAAIETTDGRYHASLWVAPEFWDAGSADQRNTIIHELLHVVAREQNDVVRASGLVKQLGQPTYEVFWDLYRQAHERMTDQLASVLASYATLPAFPAETVAPPPPPSPVMT